MGAMLFEAHGHEERYQDYPAAQPKTPAHDSGNKTNEDELPGHDGGGLTHGEQA
jgi:hypothetical protein